MYNQSNSPFSRMFQGPDKNINIVTLLTLINAIIIFGLLYKLEVENTFLEMFVTFRTLILATVAYKFRSGLKRDFGKFICVTNIIIALIANYLVYNSDINDSGWEVIDEIILNKVSEKISDTDFGIDSDDEDFEDEEYDDISEPTSPVTQQPHQAQPQIQNNTNTDAIKQKMELLKQKNQQQIRQLQQGHSIGGQ